MPKCRWALDASQSRFFTRQTYASSGICEVPLRYGGTVCKGSIPNEAEIGEAFEMSGCAGRIPPTPRVAAHNDCR